MRILGGTKPDRSGRRRLISAGPISVSALAIVLSVATAAAQTAPPKTVPAKTTAEPEKVALLPVRAIQPILFGETIGALCGAIAYGATRQELACQAAVDACCLRTFTTGGGANYKRCIEVGYAICVVGPQAYAGLACTDDDTGDSEDCLIASVTPKSPARRSTGPQPQISAETDREECVADSESGVLP